MTAEAAVINSNAVALAADSAVTIKYPDGEKIYRSANKIFALSQYNPVGCMIYGSASLCEIPWETVIKAFRRELGNTAYDSLEAYAWSLIQFIRDHKEMFPADRRHAFAKRSICSYFFHILKSVEKRLTERFSNTDGLTVRQLKLVVTEVIDEHWSDWENATPCENEESEQRFAARNRDLFEECIEQIFENLPISNRSHRRLRQIATWILTRYRDDYRSPVTSGIVVAGFGTNEYLPSLCSYVIAGLPGEDFIHCQPDPRELGTIRGGPAIIPFAQQEMVYTFMEGIHPLYEHLVNREINELMTVLPDLLLEPMEDLGGHDEEDLRARLTAAGQEALSELNNALKGVARKEFADPILDVINVLPKDELAEIARSLVNLTSFRRRVSLQPETVGGPIDVAVISKGDGFVWINRKHYFDRRLNPRYFARMQRDFSLGDQS